MASPFKTPLKTGRLSLLSSDIEEDLGLIDFNDAQFDFLSKEEYWPFEDVDFGDYNTYDVALEWLNSTFSPCVHDPYFDVKNSHRTPLNGLGQFDYLTKSVARNATITRRKIENEENSQTPKFGTITKRVIHHEKPRSPVESSKINRTFDILKENGSFSETQSENLTDSNSDSPMLPSENSQTFTRPSNLSNGSHFNTNTITKNRRIGITPTTTRYDDSLESDFIGSVANDFNSTCDSEELPSEDSNNFDLSRRNHPLNRTYDKTSNDIDDSTNVQSSRNYPTISRNITRTLRREASQGNLTYSNPMKQSQPHYSTSNDDLLSSDSSSIHSGRSNLTMTSSISGRSEPNLAHKLSIPTMANPNKKLPTRSVFSASKQIPSSASKARPLSQNGPINGMTRKPMSKLPCSNNTYGSMNSLQANMTRTASQTSIGMELNDDNENIFLNGNASKLMSAVSRNSTFRVNRPTPIVNVASVFAEQPVANLRNTSSIKYNSDDNILHCSQEEIDEFRAKVLNSSIGNLRTIHAYQPQQEHNHHNYNNRSDSPSSNSSTCSSTSSSSRMRIASNTNLANRLNNNGSAFSHGTNGSFDIDSKELGLKGISNNNNNHNSTFASNNNSSVGLMSNFDRNGTITNSKATSRIPALPKSIATPAQNRSSIPVSGAIQTRISPNNETMLRKSKLASAYQSQSSNKMGPHLIVNPLDDNSWKNDCF